MTPALSTSRLALVPYTAGMVTEQHIAWLNDKDVVKYSEQRHKTHTLETQHKYLNEFPVGSHVWLIKCSDNLLGPDFSDHIGTITAYVDRPNRVANMGIMIGEKGVWGQGYGSEAWDAVIDFLFSQDGIRKIECGCMHLNEPMRALAMRSGMHMEGTLTDHFFWEDEPQFGLTSHLVMYGLMWYNMYQAKDREESTHA